MIKRILAFGINYLAAIFTLLILFSGFQSHSQVAMFHAHNQMPAADLLLDQYPATFALSLQKIKAAYTGPLVKVRRSSDNTEQDIYPVSGGVHLDTNALKTFVGAGTGRVILWYCQMDAFDAVTVSSESDNFIVQSGVVVRNEDGNVAIRFLDAINGSVNSGFRINNWHGTTSNPLMYSIVTSLKSAGYYPAIITGYENGGQQNDGLNMGWDLGEAKGRTFTRRGATYSVAKNATAWTFNQTRLVFSTADRTNVNHYENGILAATIADLNANFSSFTSYDIGSLQFNGALSDVLLCEIIGWNNATLSDRTSIQTIVNANYSIY
jgi:hypothetical protein